MKKYSLLFTFLSITAILLTIGSVSMIQTKKDMKTSGKDNTNIEETTEISKIGTWYESKTDSTSYPFRKNPTYLEITKQDGEKETAHLYLTKIGEFEDIEFKADGREYAFDVTSENATTKEGEKGSIRGSIKYSNDTYTVIIRESNMDSLELKEYSFVYQVKDVTLENYQGTWYEDEYGYDSLKENGNPTSMELTVLDDHHLQFDLYLSRTANFNHVEAYAKGTFVFFTGTSYNTRSTDNDEDIATISGYLELEENSIRLIVQDSNATWVPTGTVHEFTYQAQ